MKEEQQVLCLLTNDHSSLKTITESTNSTSHKLLSKNHFVEVIHLFWLDTSEELTSS